MTADPSRPPDKLTETEAKAGSKTLANRNIMLISIIIVVIAFVGIYAYFA